MPRPKRRSRPPAPPAEGEPAGQLPSDRVHRTISVKLDPDERKVLGKCRRLLAGQDGDTYPTMSHVMRLALGALYHSLTGHPPDELNAGQGNDGEGKSGQ